MKSMARNIWQSLKKHAGFPALRVQVLAQYTLRPKRSSYVGTLCHTVYISVHGLCRDFAILHATIATSVVSLPAEVVISVVSLPAEVAAA